MKLAILLIITLITLGVVFSTTSLGQQGFLTAFLTAFGLLCLIGFFAIVILAGKRKQ